MINGQAAPKRQSLLTGGVKAPAPPVRQSLLTANPNKAPRRRNPFGNVLAGMRPKLAGTGLMKRLPKRFRNATPM